jgi:hypothetical protein
MSTERAAGPDSRYFVLCYEVHWDQHRWREITPAEAAQVQDSPKIIDPVKLRSIMWRAENAFSYDDRFVDLQKEITEMPFGKLLDVINRRLVEFVRVDGMDITEPSTSITIDEFVSRYIGHVAQAVAAKAEHRAWDATKIKVTDQALGQEGISKEVTDLLFYGGPWWNVFVGDGTGRVSKFYVNPKAVEDQHPLAQPSDDQGTITVANQLSFPVYDPFTGQNTPNEIVQKALARIGTFEPPAPSFDRAMKRIAELEEQVAFLSVAGDPVLLRDQCQRIVEQDAEIKSLRQQVANRMSATEVKALLSTRLSAAWEHLPCVTTGAVPPKPSGGFPARALLRGDGIVRGPM